MVIHVLCLFCGLMCQVSRFACVEVIQKLVVWDFWVFVSWLMLVCCGGMVLPYFRVF